jgi:hypothetical protein
LPARYAGHRDLLERVPECQTPLFLAVKVGGGACHTLLTGACHTLAVAHIHTAAGADTGLPGSEPPRGGRTGLNSTLKLGARPA